MTDVLACFVQFSGIFPPFQRHMSNNAWRNAGLDKRAKYATLSDISFVLAAEFYDNIVITRPRGLCVSSHPNGVGDIIVSKFSVRQIYRFPNLKDALVDKLAGNFPIYVSMPSYLVLKFLQFDLSRLHLANSITVAHIGDAPEVIPIPFNPETFAKLSIRQGPTLADIASYYLQHANDEKNQQEKVFSRTLVATKSSAFITGTYSTQGWYYDYDGIHASRFHEECNAAYNAGVAFFKGDDSIDPVLYVVAEDLEAFIQRFPDRVFIHSLHTQMFSPFASVNKAAEKAEVLIDDISNTASSVNSFVDVIKQDYAKAIAYFKGFFSSLFPKTISSVLSDVILLVDFLRELFSEDVYGVLSCIVRFFIRLGIPEHIVESFVSWYSGAPLTSTPASLYCQIDACKDDLAIGMVNPLMGEALEAPAVIVAIIGIIMCKKMPTNFDIKSVTDYCRTFNVIVPAFKNFSVLFSDLPNWMPACVQQWINYLCPASLYAWYLDHGFRDFSNDCEAFFIPVNEMKIKYDRETQAALLVLRTRASTILDDLARFPKPVTVIMTQMREIVKKLESWRDMVLDSEGKKPHRKTPYVICLFGPPNTGKSTLAALFAQLLKPKNWPDGNLVYARNGVDPFWSAYNNQFMTELDDLNSFKEDTVLREFITMISNCPMLLNMPSLTDPITGRKGTAFSSPLVCYTTNHGYPHLNEMLDPEPFYRRRNRMFKLTVKDCYVDSAKKPMYDKIPADVNDLMEYLEWVEYEPLVEAPKNNGRVLTTREVFRDVIIDFKRHTVEQDMMMEKLGCNPVVQSVRDELQEYILEGQMYQQHIINEATANLTKKQCIAVEMLDSTNVTDPKTRREYLDNVYAFEQDVRRISREHRERAPPCDVGIQTTYDKCFTLADHCYRNEKGQCSYVVGNNMIPSREMMYDATVPTIKPVYGDELTRKLLLIEQQGIVNLDLEPTWYVKAKEELEVQIVQFMKDHPLIAIALTYTAVICSATFILGVFRYLFKKKRCPECLSEGGCDCFYAESNPYYQAERTQRPHRARLHANPTLQVHQLRNEAYEELLRADVPDARDVGALNLAEDVLGPSMVMLSLPHLKRSVVGIRIGADLVLTVSHFFKDIKGNYLTNGITIDVAFETGTPHMLIHFDKSKITYLKNQQDSVLYPLGPRVPAGANRVKHFVSREMAHQIEGKPAALVSMSENHFGNPILRVHSVPVVRCNASNEIVTYHFDYDGAVPDKYVHRMLKYYGYNSVTRPGDCGAVLFVIDKTMQARCIGIHVAGGTFSAAEPVWREDLEEAVRRAKPQFPGLQGAILPIPNIIEHPLGSQCRISGNFSILGTLPRNKQIMAATKTSILRSNYYQLFGKALTAPSVLHPSDPRLEQRVSPLIKGVEKYGCQSGYFEDHFVESVYEALIRQWGTPTFLLYPENTKPPVLSVFDAINGIPGVDGFDSINGSTSPGYFYKLEGIKYKRDLLDGDFPFAVPKHPLLKLRLALRMAYAERGIRIPSVYVASLKDERRPLEKIAQGKTRVFASGDMDAVVVGRQLMLHFAVDFMRSRIKTSSAVGIDAFSDEWDRMIYRLLDMSATGFAGDFGRFDGTLAPQGTWLMLRLMNHYYDGTEKENLARAVMVDEMIHNVQLCLDTVIMTHGGNPSGNCMTVILNTIVHDFYLRYVWLTLAPADQQNMVAFDNNVRCILYGDDDIVAVHPRAQHFYNMKSVTKAFAILGIEYLPPSKKEDETLTVAPILTWPFLKCMTTRIANAPNSNQYFAQMNWENIVEMTYWIRAGDDDFQAGIDNVNSALRMAFYHGPEKFNFLRSAILKKHRQAKWPYPALLTFEELWRERFVEHSLMGEASHRPVGPFTTMGTGEPSGGAGGIEGAVGGDSEAIITERVGVAITDQQQPETITVSDGASAPAQKRAEQMMPDINWTLKDSVEKPTPVSTISWTASQTRGTQLAQYLIPFDLLQTNTISLPFRNWTYWNGNTLVEIKVNGVPQQQGCLCFYYTPSLNKQQQTAWHGSPNYAAMTSVQHFFIEPGANKPMNMLIPFNNINQHINIKTQNAQYDYCGTLGVTVFNQLRAATGVSNTCTITVHASFLDAHFHLPQAIGYTPSERWGRILKLQQYIEESPVDESVPPPLRVVAGFNIHEQERIRRAAHTVKKMRDALGGDFDLLDDAMQVTEHRLMAEGSSSSKTDNSVTYVVTANDKATVPIKTDVKGGSSSATADVDAKVDATIPAEMDKVNLGASLGTQAIVRSMNWTSHAAGIELCHRFSLYANSLSMCDHEHFGTTQDEMNLAYLFSKLTFMSAQQLGTNDPASQSIITINTSTAVNTVVASGLICVCPKLVDTYSWPEFQKIYQDALSYLALPLSHWHGALVFKFMIICTPYHSIRLVFTPTYGSYTVPTTVSAVSDQMSYYMDVTAEHHEMTVQIPYHFQRAYNRVPHGPNSDVQAFAIGVWSLRTQTALVAPDNVANFIEINMFQGGGPDFAIANFFDNNNSIIPLMGQMSVIQGATNTATTEPDAHLATAPIFKRSNVQFGEHIVSIKDMLKRYWSCGGITDASAGGGPTVETSAYSNYVRLTGSFTLAEALSHGASLYYGCMYGYYRGTIRLKVLVNVTSDPRITTQTNTTSAHQIPDYHSVLAYSLTDKYQYTGNSLQIFQASFAQLFGVGIFDTGIPSQIAVRRSDAPSQLVYPLFNQSAVTTGGLNAVAGIRMSLSSSTGTGPFNFVTRDKPVHEIEIPWASEYEVLYTPFRKNGTQHADRNLYNTGTVNLGLVCFPYDDTNPNDVDAGKVGIRQHHQVMASIGDEFRYGAFLGPVACMYLPIQTGSSNYIPYIGDTYTSG